MIDDTDAAAADADVRGLLVETLSIAGYEVREAADGLAGLELMASRPPDLRLIDYLMPGLDEVTGRNGTSAVGQLPLRTGHLPVPLQLGLVALWPGQP